MQVHMMVRLLNSWINYTILSIALDDLLLLMHRTGNRQVRLSPEWVESMALKRDSLHG